MLHPFYFENREQVSRANPALIQQRAEECLLQVDPGGPRQEGIPGR